MVRFLTADFSRDQPRFVELRRRHSCHVRSIDPRGDGGGLGNPRHLGSRLTQAFQKGHLDPEPLCSLRHDLGARALTAAGVVDPQVPRARAESTRMLFVVAHVGANPLIVCDDPQVLGGDHKSRNLFRMLREEANRALALAGSCVDRLELRVIQHHCGEEQGQSLEGVVDQVNQGQLRERGRVHTSCHASRPSQAHHLRRHIFHQSPWQGQ